MTASNVETRDDNATQKLMFMDFSMRKKKKNTRTVFGYHLLLVF